MNRELTSTFDRLHYHISMIPNELQSQERVEEILLPLDSIGSVSPAAVFWIRVEGDYFNFFTRNNLLQVFGLDPASGIIQYDYVEGTGWRDDPERDVMVISVAIAKQTGLGVGDSMNFTVSGKRVTREIIGVDRNGFDFAWLKWQDLAQLAGSVEGAPRPNNYVVISTIPDRSAPVFAVGMDESLLAFIDDSFDTDNPGVIISGALAESEGLSAGDTITLTVGGETVERAIIAVIPNAIMEQTAQTQMPGIGAIPDDVALFGFNDLTTITGVDTQGEPVPNGYYVTTSLDDPTPDQVDEVMDEANIAMLEQGIGARYVNLVLQSEVLTELIITNTSIIGAATLLIGAVGAIGLLTTLSIAVLERQKEIGVMRSIGATSGVIGLQFVIEGLIVGFVSWVFSIPVSFMLARQLFKVLQLENVPFSYPPQALVIGLIGILLISAISSLGPSMSAARKTVSDILRYQ
jgi:ABC-type antimicrobial peptide transport system permease subunit